MNASYFAGDPTAAGVARLEEIWRGIRRRDVFPVTVRSALGPGERSADFCPLASCRPDR
jgi:hypothetical protein